MKSNDFSFLKFKRKICILFFTLLAALSSISQNANFSLGSLNMVPSTNKAAPLAQKAKIGKMIFHRRVGGISFEEIAVPSEKVGKSSIELIYNFNNQDGERLKISFGKTGDSIYNLNISDWQLVPIALFANDTTNAVVTIVDGYRYHEAFTDNLLGWRMFQADILLTSKTDKAWDVPRNRFTNKPFLADSELSLEPDTLKIDYYESIEYSILNIRPYLSDSYILTDWGKEVKFGVGKNTFYITGEPYYLFTSNYIRRDKTPDVNFLCSSLESMEGVDTESLFYKGLSKICNGVRYSWQLEKIKELMEKNLYDFEKLKLDLYNVIEAQNNEDGLINENRQVSELIASLATQSDYEDFVYEIRNSQEYFDYISYKEILLDSINKNYQDGDVGQRMKELKVILETTNYGVEEYNSTKNLLYQLWLDSSDGSNLELAVANLRNVPIPNILSELTEVDLENYRNENKLLDGISDLLISAESNSYISESYVRLFKGASENLELAPELLYEYNPIIYNSTTIVMRYSALFRYIKLHYPTTWNNFIAKIEATYSDLSKPENWPNPAPSRPNDPVNDGFLTPGTIDYD